MGQEVPPKITNYEIANYKFLQWPASSAMNFS